MWGEKRKERKGLCVRPKLSLGMWAFAFGPFSSQPWSFTRILEFAVNAGYDGVEVNGFRPHLHPEDYTSHAARRTLQSELKGFGLGVSGFAPDFTAVPPAIVDTAQYVEVVKRYADFCHVLGTDTLRVDTVSKPEAQDLI